MKLGYALCNTEGNIAKAQGRDLPISLKQAIEISNYIRNDNVAKAIAKLDAAINLEKAVPFRKYTNALGHKKGSIGSGRFAVKACSEIKKILKSAESNALFKGMNSKSLVVFHIAAKKAGQAWHYGRQSRRRMKRCHIEIALREALKENIQKNVQKDMPKDTPKEKSN